MLYPTLAGVLLRFWCNSQEKQVGFGHALKRVKYSMCTLTKESKKLYGPFYGWGSTASRLQSHYEEAVYFLPKFPEIHGTHLINLRANQQFLNTRPLDWQSSTLTTTPQQNALCNIDKITYKSTNHQALFQSNLVIVVSILGACNLGTQIKDLYTYMWR